MWVTVAGGFMSTNHRVTSRLSWRYPTGQGGHVYISDVRYTGWVIEVSGGENVISPELYRIRGASIAISGVYVRKKELRMSSRGTYLHSAPVSVKRNLIQPDNAESIRSNRVPSISDIWHTLLLFVSSISYQDTLDVRIYIFFIIDSRYISRERRTFLSRQI